MTRLIDWCLKPKILLLIFPTYPDLKRWLDTHKKDIIDYGGKIKLTTLKITFQTGATLYLGHGNKEEDFDRYLGLEYDAVIGGSERLRIRSLINRL
jgi:hypothetical protein